MTTETQLILEVKLWLLINYTKKLFHKNGGTEIQHRQKTEEMLLLVTKNKKVLIEQTLTKPQETLEI